MTNLIFTTPPRCLTIRIFLLLSFLFPGLLKSQQFGFYSMYQNNWQIICPAAPNFNFIKDNTVENILSLSYRQQWMGLKGSPSNYNAYFETMVENGRSKLNMKWGFGIYGESAGPLLNNTLYVNYAYPISFEGRRSYNGGNKLYIGFNAGYFNQRIDFNKINYQDGFDETVITVMQSQNLLSGQSYFEFSPSVYYTNTENFYIGVSSPRLVNTTKTGSNFQILNAKPQVHLIIGGYNENFTFQPSIWVRYQPGISYLSLIQNAPLSATINFRSQINKQLLLGIGLSTGQWLHLEAGWQLSGGNSRKQNGGKTRSINFAYDLPVYKTGFNLGQTAEVNLFFSL